MSRVAKTLPVSPQMFRHFAIITVGITLCIAMFADGESRQAIEDEFSERQAQNEMLRADAARGANRPLVRRTPTRGSFSADVDETAAEFGGVMDTSTARGGTVRYRGSSGGPARPGSDGTGDPLSDEAMAAEFAPRMEIGADGKPRPATRRPPPRPTPEQLQALRESSRLRSGSPDGGD